MPFSFVVPLLSLPVTHCHLLSLVVNRCVTRYHSLSLIVPLVVFRCHSLTLVIPPVVLLVAIRCQSLYHSLSLVVIRCPSLPLYVPLVCHFINDLKDLRKLLDQTESSIRNLNSLDVTTDIYGILLVPLINDNLPDYIRTSIAKKFDDEI